MPAAAQSRGCTAPEVGRDTYCNKSYTYVCVLPGKGE